MRWPMAHMAAAEVAAGASSTGPVGAGARSIESTVGEQAAVATAHSDVLAAGKKRSSAEVCEPEEHRRKKKKKKHRS